MWTPVNIYAAVMWITLTDDWFPRCSRPVGSLVAACGTSVLETGELFSSVSCTSPSMLFLPSAPLTLCFSACRTWFRYSGAPGLPGGSGELERRSGLLPVEGQETAYWGGVGVGCTWRAARYTESVAYTLYVPRWWWSFAAVWWFVCI